MQVGYVTIKHPVRGDNILAVPTGKTRQTKSSPPEIEAEVRIITPKCGIDTLWITKEQIVHVSLL